MNKLTKIAAAASLLLGLGLAGTAQASPYLSIVGGGSEVQDFTTGTAIIPNGARGYDNLPVSIPPGTPAVPSPMGLYLMDTDPLASGARTVRIDYVGSDASLVDQYFTASGINWCNHANTGCGSVPGNNNLWSGPYSATAYLTATIGALIPFTFSANLDAAGVPQYSLANGSAGTLPTGHLFYASMDGGDMTDGFFSTDGHRTGTIMALGLTDGNNANLTDDDHQDSMIRVSTVPEPGSMALLGLGLLAMAGLRRRRS